YALPIVLTTVGLLAFNLLRFGSLSETGYTQEISFSAPWVGAFGLLFSPGNGLFIYSPVLILLFFGLRPAWKQLPRLYFWLIVSISLFYILFYGSWFSWGGTWGWGPRFLLPILPLLMVFVASNLRFTIYDLRLKNPKHLIIGALIVLSLAVNLLGLIIDFNDYYNQLSGNDNFVFNWGKFPPLAHWRILQAGGDIDLIWLQGNHLHLHLLLPPAIILLMATLNLVSNLGFGVSSDATKNQKPETRNLKPKVAALAISVFLTLLMLAGASHLALATEQSQADAALLEVLKAESRPADALLTAMPPFADAQEFSTWLMAWQDRRLPGYTWIEYGPRAIQTDERERIWRATGNARRVWLFERWLTHADPLSQSARYLEQNAFPVQEVWFEKSGKLGLYALARSNAPKIPLDTPFEGGLTLLDFALLNEQLIPGDILKLRLTWQAEAVNASANLPPGPTIAFAQLVAEADGQVAAQQDRLLIDLQAVKQSPLLPGQTITQGYGLRLPEDLSPGAYFIIVGLYNAATTQRLPRANNPDDFLYLSTVTVNNERDPNELTNGE
ncbi:MAG TPA: hypothetical protein G4N96_08825, partial [Chloroflexi bacterium]|nr:hypothetical protein [Chloroflexota bacterium]